MLVLKIFCVFDSKADAFLSPFFMPNKGMAIRGMASVCADPTHDFNIHGGDFTLFEIGEYDTKSGRITSYDVFENLGTMLQVLNTITQAKGVN